MTLINLTIKLNTVLDLLPFPTPMYEISAPLITAFSLKLSPFWPKDPALWFLQVETQLATSSINQHLSQYNYLVESLLPETAREVCDVKMNRPEDNPYDTLKACLISCISLNQSQRVQKLISLRPLGDLRPSQLCRHLSSSLKTMVISCIENLSLSSSFISTVNLEISPNDDNAGNDFLG